MKKERKKNNKENNNENILRQFFKDISHKTTECDKGIMLS